MRFDNILVPQHLFTLKDSRCIGHITSHINKTRIFHIIIMSNRRNYTKYLFESPSVAKGEEEELKRGDFEFIKRLGDGAFG